MICSLCLFPLLKLNFPVVGQLVFRSKGMFGLSTKMITSLKILIGQSVLIQKLKMFQFINTDKCMFIQEQKKGSNREVCLYLCVMFKSIYFKSNGRRPAAYSYLSISGLVGRWLYDWMGDRHHATVHHLCLRPACLRLIHS